MAKGAYIGVAKQTYKNSLGDLAVGSTVKLNENGVPADYLVVNQGNPKPDIYDTSCDGTWLLRKYIYSKHQWSNDDVSVLESSTIHTFLNGYFLGLFDADIQAQIKQVKIPYRKNGGYGTDQSGTNGFLTKIFLLSSKEVGFTTGNNGSIPNDGAVLSYFDGGGNSKRVAAYNNGAAEEWWLRSQVANNSTGAWYVRTDGSLGPYGYICSYSCGIRPALVLPSNLSAANGIVTGEVAESVSTGIARKIKKGYVGVYTQSDVVTTVTGGPASSTCSESKPVWDAEQSKYVLPSGGYVTNISDLRDNYAPDPPPVYYIITDRTTYYSVDESTSTTIYKKCVRVAGPVARKIKRGYIGVEGVARLCFADEVLISFTISGTSYQAVEGMTWLEWCNSIYNTINLLCYSATGPVTDSMFVVKYAGAIVIGSNKIRSGGGYTMQAGGGNN